MHDVRQRPIEILLVEDSPSDTHLTLEALLNLKLRNKLHIVDDGEQALAFLHRQGAYSTAPRPDLILLDLNLPRKDGREVLAEIKADEALKTIPVVVMTSSREEQDLARVYDLHANCCVIKPMDFDKFLEAVRAIEMFWLSVVALPPAQRAAPGTAV